MNALTYSYVSASMHACMLNLAHGNLLMFMPGVKAVKCMHACAMWWSQLLQTICMDLEVYPPPSPPLILSPHLLPCFAH